MLLCELLVRACVKGVFLEGNSVPDLYGRITVLGISTASGKTLPGDVFVCINGEHTDGHLYAADAVNRGAVCVVAEKKLCLGVPVVVVDNTRRAAAYMWSSRYGDPAGEMKIIAITGTNGKTSVSFMLRHLLRCGGFRTGMIGTVMCTAEDEVLETGGGSESSSAAAMTTPDPAVLYGLLREMRLRGVTHVVMEASSHALSQYKLEPISPDIAVFTGLSPEHLDHHGTMENYLSAKSALFCNAKCGIINGDDSYAERLCIPPSCRVIRAGAYPDGAYDISACGIRMGRGEVRYRLSFDGGRIGIRCPMPGRFGVYNSLMASAAALECSVSPDTVRRAFPTFCGVPGRMELIGRLGRLRVIRDFAHTPDALRGALEILKAEKDSGKLWLLFGCGGDRDKSKRPEMGRIAADLADYTVITSDNCRSENRDDIICDILDGFDLSKPHAVIPDRGEAVRYAVLSAGDRDTVLLCGKGHENYEITAEGMRPFDEAAIAMAAIEERRSPKRRGNG